MLLGIETMDGETFTLVRSTEGGPFKVFDGLHVDAVPDTEEAVELAEQHNERRDDNLSTFLLAKVGLDHKRLRKNKRNDTQSLSIRNLARLLIINEEEIIQKRSPLSDGNYVADTPNTALFKLLLTGVDDSALASASRRTPEEQSRDAQIDLLDQLITEYRGRVKELAGPPAELESQLGRLDKTMYAHSEQLAVSEAQFREAANRRRELLKRLEEGNNRLAEMNSTVSRFVLLDTHYSSDIERLRGIQEAGSLFSALGEASCPLCGAAPEHHRRAEACDGDVDAAVSAASAEIAKIEVRQTELKDTVADLQKEAVSFQRRLPKIEEAIAKLSEQVESMLAPNLRQLRTSYRQLADKRGEVREALSIYQSLKDLEERRTRLEAENGGMSGSGNVSDVDLSTSTVDKFATLILEILTDWKFPHADRVHFDLRTRDLVINGKNRTSYGKGLRAITQAAFTIGLLEFCRRNGTPHPGFVVLDSPLLSYREPEGPADDLSKTDLNTRFYAFLDALPADRQVIIVENTDPPAEVKVSDQAIEFTGVPGAGRAGFFPLGHTQATPKPCA
ncbi:hypothetical protein [Microvirga mediterraneensis]|uniref:hypothetical protein n=1 Tax=Microvirga mediterraneensis TaxID=2754695 RepID=UPI003CCDC908